MLKGVEQTLNATGMTVRRLTDEEMFLELKRAMNPLFRDDIVYRRPELTIDYRSAREQAANTHIEDDQATYIKIGGLLYSFLSLKDLPECHLFPVSFANCSARLPAGDQYEVSIPDQAERLKLFKGRLRPHDRAASGAIRHGGFKVNVDARVAEGQLMQTLQDLISSSLKSAQVSVVMAVRTSTRSRAAGFGGSRNESLRTAGNGRCTPSLRMNGRPGLAGRSGKAAPLTSMGCRE